MDIAQEEQQQQEQSEPPQTVTFTGIPCPKCHKVFSNQIGLRMHNLRKHTPGKGWDTGANFKKKKKHGGQGQPWRPGQLEKFRATMRARARRKAKGIQIVYPLPSIQEEETAAVRIPDHCPHCGENIRAWRYEP